MRKILLFAILAVFMYSCGKTEKKKNEFSNDMENSRFWTAPTSIVKCDAHSGTYASKLDSANIYSYGFQSPIENVVNSKPKKINITIWVYALQPNTDASVVVDINNNGQSKFWNNSTINGLSKTKEWTEFKTSFDLPANLDVKDELKIYVWNPKQKELYIDDFDISFE